MIINWDFFLEKILQRKEKKLNLKYKKTYNIQHITLVTALLNTQRKTNNN